MGIENDWAAWQFDNAVLAFGRYVENKLNERDKKGKPKYRLEDLLSDTPTNTLSALLLASGKDTLDL